MEAPGRHRGDHHHAVGIGHIGGLSRRPPVSLQRVELDLGDNDAQRAAGWIIDAPRQIETRPAADGAEGEEAGLAVAHGLEIIGSEAVVRADETGRQTPVAGRQRATVGVEGVDGGRADLLRQCLEFLVETRGARRIGPAEKGFQIGVLGEDHGQGAVPFQFTAKDCRMKRTRRRRLVARRSPCVTPRDLAARDHSNNSDDAPRDAEHAPLSRW